MKRYALTVDAADDLRAITEYYEPLSPRFTTALIKRIAERCRHVGRFPRSGRDRSDWHPGLRSSPVDDYVIYFRKVDRVVQIIRVMHGARNVGPKDFQF